MKYKSVLSLCLLVILAFTSVFAFSSCSDGEKNETTAPVSTEASTEETVSVNIDKRSFDDTFNEAEFYASLDDIGGITHTFDGQKYTLTMTKSAYEYLKKVKARAVEDAFKNVIADTGNYVENISGNDDYREIIIYAARDKFPAASVGTVDITAVTVAAEAMAYQLYTVEGQKTNVKVVYSDNGETATAFQLPIVTG